MLLLLLLIGGGGSYAWGETKTITLDKIGIGLDGSLNTSVNTTSISLNNGSDKFVLNYFQGKKQVDAIFLAKSTGAFISNNTPVPGTIKSVEVFINTGASGKTTYHCAFSTLECTKAYKTGSTAVNIKGGKPHVFNCGVENASYFCISLGNANNGQVLKLVITYEDSSTPQPGEVALPTLSLAEGTYWKTQTLTIGVPEGAAGVKYTLDGTDPKESNTAKSITEATALELSATTTVKAVAVDNNKKYSKEVSRTYTFVSSIANTKETAYTTADAIAIIDKTSEAQLADEVVYVKGVVSKIVSYSSTHKSITYWLDDNTFQVYGGMGLDNKGFNSKEDIETGANVIICGKIKKYSGKYEFDIGNYLVEYKAPVEKVLKLIAISGEATKTTYKEGEAFDPTGLVVTATYDDESTKDVTSRVEWTFNPETLTLGATEVNVTATYGEKTASKTVAVTVIEVQKYNVTWNVNGKVYTEGAPTTEVVEGEKLSTLPTAPASIGGLVFMGWTNEAVTSQEAAPAVLFTSAADAPAVTANVTYYAVFAAQTGTGWIRVTELSDITEGSYVIKNDGFILPNSKTDKSPQKVTAPSITDNVITGEVGESMVWQFVSTGVSNQFYIKNASGDYLYVIKGESQGLRVADTPDEWTFEENGEGCFSMRDAKGNRYCATYKDGKDWRSYVDKDYRKYANDGKLELYRNDISYSNYTTSVETLPLRAFDGKNYFATFSSDKAVKFVDATVYAVGVNDDRLILTEVESKQVPANTGVLLKSASTEATYSVIGSAPAIENNLLCASVEEGETTAADGTTEGYSFFKLSYNQAGENEKLGFYWAKENGAPFVSKAGLAYLAVKTADAAAVKGFSLFDMETGISKVSGSAAGNGVIYDLQGRRVERAVRGLYIVNGRKVMVK